MTLKTKIVISIVALAAAFAAGRYSNQKPTVKTTIDQTQQTQIDQTKNTQQNTITVIDKKPDGEVVTTIHNDVDTETAKQTEQQTQTQIQQTVTPPKLNMINISALAGLDTTRDFTPIYGLSATKNLIGPVTVGAWGLTNGTVGISIGLSF